MSISPFKTDFLKVGKKVLFFIIAFFIATIGVTIINQKTGFFTKVGTNLVSGAGSIFLDTKFGIPIYNPVLAQVSGPYSDVQGNVSISGNVGIGTTNPTQKLEIAGNIEMGRNRLFFNNDGGSVASDSDAGIYWHLLGSGTGADYAIYRTPGAWTANTYQQLKLDWPTGIILEPGNGDNTGYDKSYVEIRGGKGLRVTQGNVGIGTTNPTQKLDIVGTINVNSGGSWGLMTSGGAGSGGIYTNTPNWAFYGDNSASKSYFAGNVGIGTNAPVNLLHIYDNRVGSTPSIKVESGVSASFPFISLLDSRTSGSNWQIENGRPGAGQGLGFYLGGSGAKMTLSTAGNLAVSGCVTYNSSTLGTCLSDIRLKKNINPLNFGLAQILGLNPVTYEYNGLGGTIDDGNVKSGLIAQEVEKTAPGLVSTTSVKLHPEDSALTQIKNVNYSVLTFALINAVKEQQKEIESLKKEINDLKNSK